MKLYKLDNLFEQAFVVAKNSKDPTTKVGCIIVHPETLSQQSTGYNNPVRNAPDDLIPKTRPEKYVYFQHAEVNAVCQAAALGKAISGCIAISTLSPCSSCLRILWQSNIHEVYFKDEYRDFQGQLEMLDLGIDLEKIGCYTKLSLYGKGTKQELL